MMPTLRDTASVLRATATFLFLAVLALACSGTSTGDESDGDGYDSVACSGHQADCGGVCIDPLTDNLSCGSCGAACVPGSRCTVGECECTNTGFTACADACLDTTTDPNNCGGCAVGCDAFERCDASACSCRLQTQACGDTCAQLLSDPVHCGFCDNACPEVEVCSLGTCSDSCAETLTQCGRSCVDLQTDFANCGACGTLCDSGLECQAGVCSCPAGQELCAGSCVDVTQSNLHCGACDNSCAPGASCEGGSCSCGGGQMDCGGVCVSTQTNSAHCGACENACPSNQSCQAGKCTGSEGGCADGLSDCSGTCVDLLANTTHCGACGTDCGSLACVEGTCQAVKLCANAKVITNPTIATFETYDGTMPVTNWGFAFNAPAGDPQAVYSGLYTFSDGVGSHALSMSTGNASSYAPRIRNPAPGGAGAWGGTVAMWMGCIDASAYTGFSLWVKGPVPTGTVSLAVSMEGTTPPDAQNPDAGGTCNAGCSEASVEISVGSSWSQVFVPFSAFTPGTANQSSIPVTGEGITGLSFSVPLAYVEDVANPGTYIPGSAPYDFSFDDLTLTTGSNGCSGGRAQCGTSCIDTQTNAAHCGGCEQACPEGQGCSGGNCTCTGGLTACGDTCVDTTTDVYHCGGCDKRCLGTCSNGMCTTNACGATDSTPFGCKFAWGANGNSGNRSSYLDFITTWIGYEYTQGRPNDCDGCGLVTTLASTNAIPGFYAYFIGYALPDCNVEPNNPNNLCHAGAQYIRDNRSAIISRYANYAQKAYQANPNKPVVWLLEGDFVQYTYAEQSNPLSLAELGALAGDITCAIKGAAPNALVAVNHSPWVANNLANQFWDAMPLADFDFVWTTGTGTNNGYINADTSSSTYNAATATYAWVHGKTGMGILVDTSFGPSQQADSWSSATSAQLNARISEGVIAANVTQPPDNYQTRVNTLSPLLSSTCQ